MKRLATLASLAAAVLAGTATARADDPITLRWAYTAPLTSPTYTRWWGPWVERLNKEAEGIFKVDVYAGSRLANLVNVYDRLVSNVYEFGYGIHGTIAGKFPRTSVCILPFIADDSEIASGALWNLYKSGVIAEEYADTRPIALFVYAQNDFNLTKPVQKLEDVQGLKIGVPARVTSKIVEALGALPVSVPVTEYYQATNRGLIDGIAVGWSGVLQFKVHEVTSYHLELGLGAGSGFFLMNKGAYAKLPAKGREIIDKYSGLDASLGFGKVLDGIAKYQRTTVSKIPNHTIIRLPPEEVARWKERVQPVIDEWAAEVPNGQKIVEAYRAEIEKLKAMKSK